MEDREKVINEFEHLLNAAKGNYLQIVDVTDHAGEEILALLKEPQAEIEQLRNDAKARRCIVCRYAYGTITDVARCMKNKNRLNEYHPLNWFCADFDPYDEAVLDAFAEDG